MPTTTLAAYASPEQPETREPFNRFAGAPDEADSPRMASNMLDARVVNVTISELLGRLETFTEGKHEGADMYPWTSRFVMGLPLPEWQRPMCWTDEQKVRFIESIWTGVDIGSYMVNAQYEYVKTDSGSYFRKNSEVVLDGQQRLTTLEEYVLNKFSVPDEQGIPRYWRDLPRIERRRFSSFHFARSEVRSWDEAALRRAYDLRAFGGTAHTEDQRAS